MIIGAVSGIGVLAVIIITVTCLLVLCCCQKRKRSYNISSQPRNAIALNFITKEESRQSSSSSMQSHEMQNEKETANFVDLEDNTMKRSETQSMILDADSESLEEEATEAKAAIKDKQVCTLYYCGNWQV